LLEGKLVCWFTATSLFFFVFDLSLSFFAKCFFSPIQYDKKMLETIGKKLKKNNVSLDIVDFGEDKEGKPEKLEALFAAVNSNESSHIVHIPPGGVAISDALMRCDTLSSFVSLVEAAAISVQINGYFFMRMVSNMLI